MPRQLRATAVTDAQPDAAWSRRSAGAGSKGPRVYDWAVAASQTERAGRTRVG